MNNNNNKLFTVNFYIHKKKYEGLEAKGQDTTQLRGLISIYLKQQKKSMGIKK